MKTKAILYSVTLTLCATILPSEAKRSKSIEVRPENRNLLLGSSGQRSFEGRGVENVVTPNPNIFGVQKLNISTQDTVNQGQIVDTLVGEATKNLSDSMKEAELSKMKAELSNVVGNSRNGVRAVLENLAAKIKNNELSKEVVKRDLPEILKFVITGNKLTEVPVTNVNNESSPVNVYLTLMQQSGEVPTWPENSRSSYMRLVKGINTLMTQGKKLNEALAQMLQERGYRTVLTREARKKEIIEQCKI